jgi:hypothetical protein
MFFVLFFLGAMKPMFCFAWIDTRESSETQPTIKLSLGAPTNPYPEVAAEIKRVEAARELMQQGAISGLQQLYKRTFLDAKYRVGAVIGNALQGFDDPALMKQFKHAQRTPSFLALMPKPGTKQSFLIKVAPTLPVDTSIQNEIVDLETERTKMQHVEFQALEGEFRLLVDDVSSLLQNSLQRKVSTMFQSPPVFMSLPNQVNVQVLPSTGFTTVSGLVADMEHRRDISEELARQTVLNLKVLLVRDINAVIESALSRAVKRVEAQYQ